MTDEQKLVEDTDFRKMAENFGAMFVKALQGDYSLVDYYAKEMQIDFIDGKPVVSAIRTTAEKHWNMAVEECIAKVKPLCGVNPASRRPCIDHDDKFLCPVCKVMKTINRLRKEPSR
jgi:hypothetical protein